MGEFELIRKLAEGEPKNGVGFSCGIGDDCAVIDGAVGKDYLVTTDSLVEGIHFHRDWSDLATLGRKALAVNLSDIAAMGGTPKF